MTSRRSRRSQTDPESSSDRQVAPRRFGGLEALAVVMALITVVHTWWSRLALNPDGVSYLELAQRLRAGDLAAFVQGYWSPLYPAVVAGAASATDGSPVALLVASHLVNGLAVVAGIVFLLHWARERRRPRWGIAALMAFFLASAGLPRVEAVTPDVFLLVAMLVVGYELLEREGKRWVWSGLALGAAFLAKTSAGPWLLCSVPLRWWGAPDAPARRRVLQSSAVAFGVALLWIIPLSLKSGRPTTGSAGALNYEWYIASSDSRTPDTHRGGHVDYHRLRAGRGGDIVWAEFPEAERWTYEPWSDPTAWSEGVRSRAELTPTLANGVAYILRQTYQTFVGWLSPLLLAVVIPWWFMERPAAGRWRALPGDRAAAAVALLGLVGIAQFLVVHSEPRLVAPFALLTTLAVLHTPATAGERPPFALRWGKWVDLLGLLVILGFAWERLGDGRATAARLEGAVRSLQATDASIAAQGLSQARIVVMGEAMPKIGAAFLSGSHIVAQVLPPYVEPLIDRPRSEQAELFARLFGGKAQVAWLIDPEGGVTLVRIPEDTLASSGPPRSLR